MISLAEPMLLGNEITYVVDALRQKQLSAGQYVTSFEKLFARDVAGCDFGVATTSGTTALHLALEALGIGPGDEVIVPALTFVATANAVRYCGADVVLADVDRTTWCIDPADVEARITRRTAAVIAVHLYGQPADMGSLRSICAKHNLYLVEDAAEAPGASWAGLPVGSLGDVAAFSFYGNKIITCGEGGMLTTSNRLLADRARLLRGQAQDPRRRYWHTEIGYNYRMTELQAAVGLAQTEDFPAHLAARQRVAKWYERYGDDDLLVWQGRAADATPASWMNVALLPAATRRESVMAALDQRGIESRPAFYPLASMPAYTDLAQQGPWPTAEDVARRGLCLPSHGNLTADEIYWICEALREVVNAAIRA